jgi:hypothetical protein
MDEEKAEQTGGSHSVEPAISVSSEPKDELIDDVGKETTRELAEGSVEAPVLLASANPESPPANEPVTATEIEEAVACEATKTEAVNADPAKTDAEVAEASPADAVDDAAAAPEAEALRTPGKLLVLASRDRDRAHDGAGPHRQKREWTFDHRRVAAVVAVLALATTAGALGGAMATAGLMRAGGHAASGDHGLEASMARIDAEILALKASLEHNSKLATNQLGKTSDRLDRIEKAQAEPAAKLTRLSEAVEKLRAAPVPLPSPPPIAAPAATTAAKEVTGSVTAPPAPAKTEVARLPTVEGWVLRDVAYGGALIEGRRGVYEVYAGDPVPGLGRVDAIRRQDGRWVVVTSRGLIVAR